jgi:hypothetical protein
MSDRNLSLIFLVIIFSFTGCAPKASFDIRGEWNYTMTDTNGNTYDDGTITFSGDPARGTYLEINVYEVEYEGEFTVNGSDLKLTGDETWDGTITDASTMNGSWSHNDGFSGTFIATRK